MPVKQPGSVRPSASPSPEEAIRKRTIWQSYAVLPAKTRLMVSLGICAIAVAGIFISDKLENIIPPENIRPLPPSTKSSSSS